MEERVKSMVKLIDEDADSFAKKAEMYFRRRPELINNVEEAYRAYKALADRYDRISGELHKANHTIATAFPDQVPMIDDDDDDDDNISHRTFSSINTDELPNPPPDAAKLPKPPPELPRLSSRVRRAEAQAQPVAPKRPRHRGDSSNVTPEKAQEEIDRLQKSILVLQTEKEFFRGSYEKGLAKYWDIERQMTEMQGEISQLQDDFNVGSVIDDDEARALMAATALKSCQDTLVGLHAQQKRSVREARLESERIKAARAIYRSLKGDEAARISDQDEEAICSPVTVTEDEVESLKHERLELQSICDKVKGLFEMSSESSVGELVEKIDELVEKIIGLEITVSSQTAQILTLRAETDELHKHLRGVEDDKKNSNVDPSSLNERLTQVEGQLQRILHLERSVQNEKGVVQSHFAEACHSLSNLSEKLQSPSQKDRPDAEAREKVSNPSIEPFIESKGVEELDKDIEDSTENVHNSDKKIEEAEEDSTDEYHNDEMITENGSIDRKELDKDENDPNWQQLLTDGVEGRDKILLYEYSSIIRNYKETRERLADIEKKNQECHSETMQQIQELRCANAIKDEEIKTLRKKLLSAESPRRSSLKKAAAAAHEPPPNQENSPRLQDFLAGAFESELGPSDQLTEGDQAKICNVDQLFTTSPLEDKFRADIDTLLEENLDFWLRFCTAYHQIQKFSLTFKELRTEAEKFVETRNEDGVDAADSAPVDQTARPESVPTDKKLRELNTELQVWLEHNGHLQGELRCRFASLCSIQEEITRVAEASEGENEDAKFTPYQAAKFQGEVINMQQENNKVAKELQAGLDHVKGLQTEVGRTLSKLREKFELSSSKARPYNQFRHLSTKSRVPLKTFLFAASKPKKPSIFACMNPAYHHHHHHHHHHKSLDTKSGKMPKAPPH